MRPNHLATVRGAVLEEAVVEAFGTELHVYGRRALDGALSVRTEAVARCAVRAARVAVLDLRLEVFTEYGAGTLVDQRRASLLPPSTCAGRRRDQWALMARNMLLSGKKTKQRA